MVRVQSKAQPDAKRARTSFSPPSPGVVFCVTLVVTTYHICPEDTVSCTASIFLANLNDLANLFI
jgi:hypothetical protein